MKDICISQFYREKFALQTMLSTLVFYLEAKTRNPLHYKYKIPEKWLFDRIIILSLSNEIQVLKPMLKDSKSKNIVDLYFEILPLQ